MMLDKIDNIERFNNQTYPRSKPWSMRRPRMVEAVGKFGKNLHVKCRVYTVSTWDKPSGEGDRKRG